MEIKELWIGVSTKDSHEDCQKAGIYYIKNSNNGQMYIGSTTVSFQDRWATHSYQLRRGSHSNKFLQSTWSKCNGSLVFGILETVEYSGCNINLLSREQHYIDKINTVVPNGYNIRATTGASPRQAIKRNEYSTSKKVAKKYTKLNEYANKTIFKNLLDMGCFTENDIEVILFEGMPVVVQVYGELFGSDIEDIMFDFCMANLLEDRLVSFEYRRSNIDRLACSSCVHHDSVSGVNKYDYCGYYDVNLPPVEINHCRHAKFSYNKSERSLMSLFERDNIDDVIEDFLGGKDYSAKRSDWY